MVVNPAVEIFLADLGRRRWVDGVTWESINVSVVEWTLSLCIEMRNYKRAKPRFEGTVLRTVWSSKLVGAELEPRQTRAWDGNTMWGWAEDNTARGKGEKEKDS